MGVYVHTQSPKLRLLRLFLRIKAATICNRAASRHKSQRGMFRLRGSGTAKHSVTEWKAPRVHTHILWRV